MMYPCVDILVFDNLYTDVRLPFDSAVLWNRAAAGESAAWYVIMFAHFL